MALELTVDTKKVEDFLDLSPKKTSVAVLRAVKRGTTAARTFAARTVAKDMGIKIGVARKAIRMTPPKGETVVGILHGSLKRIALIEFGAKGPRPSRGKGRVTYRAGGGRRTAEGGFITTVGSGHEGVFKRSGRLRLPIQELRGPSVGRVLDLHRDEVAGRGAEATLAELDRLLNRIFGARVK